MLFRSKEYLFRDNFDGVQELLDEATILIGHNIVHDLLWLWECGLKYDGAVFDTMLVEYVLQRGNKQPLSLEACANRYELATKKQETMKEYFKNKVPIDEIPKQELSDYLSADLKATQELSDVLYKKLNTIEYAGLMNTVVLTNRVSVRSEEHTSELQSRLHLVCRLLLEKKKKKGKKKKKKSKKKKK